MSFQRLVPRLKDFPATDSEREQFREWAGQGGRGPDNHDAWLAWLVERGRQMTPEQVAAVRARRQPACGRCRDTGWVHPLVLGAPDYGRVVRCHCDALEREKQVIRGTVDRERYRVAGERAAPKQTFGTFKAAVGAEAVWRVVRGWVAGPEVPWLYLQGVAGSGKTHLLQAARAELAGRGEDVHYVSVPDWLRGMYGQGLQEASMGMQALQECRWLLLDQFGQSWRQDEMLRVEELLDRRYGAAFTMIASDRGIAECPSERLRSRLGDVVGCRVVVSEAGDYRPVGAGARMRMGLCAER